MEAVIVRSAAGVELGWVFALAGAFFTVADGDGDEFVGVAPFVCIPVGAGRLALFAALCCALTGAMLGGYLDS